MNDLLPSFDAKGLQELLQRAWSSRTSSLWTTENPAKWQCAVTACSVQKLYGGEILKTPALGGWHFYNRFGLQRYDFTGAQFVSLPEYHDVSSSFAEAFTDTTLEQYNELLSTITSLLESGKENACIQPKR